MTNGIIPLTIDPSSARTRYSTGINLRMSIIYLDILLLSYELVSGYYNLLNCTYIFITISLIDREVHDILENKIIDK